MYCKLPAARLGYIKTSFSYTPRKIFQAITEIDTEFFPGIL
jgi:hypothetical protein